MKKYLQFVTGGMTALLAVGLITTALAASGHVSFNEVSVKLFKDTKIAAGAELTAQNGQAVPGSITYTDEIGGKTIYLPIRKIAEMFDSPVAWDAKTSSVQLGYISSGSSVVIGGAAEENTRTSPVLNATAGPFTEIALSAVNTDLNSVIQQNSAKIQSENGFSQRFGCFPGGYLVMSVTNNGTTAQYVHARRPVTIGEGAYDPFVSVRLDPGKTLTRAFALREDAQALTRTLELGIGSGPTQSLTNITVSVTEYRP